MIRAETPLLSLHDVLTERQLNKDSKNQIEHGLN